MARSGPGVGHVTAAECSILPPSQCGSLELHKASTALSNTRCKDYNRPFSRKRGALAKRTLPKSVGQAIEHMIHLEGQDHCSLSGWSSQL